MKEEVSLRGASINLYKLTINRNRLTDLETQLTEAHPVLVEPCGLLRGGLEERRLCPTDSSIMDIFNRKINFDALFKFSHITPSTQQHLKKVYASFALCMFVAAAGAYVHVVTHFTQAGLLSALGSLGLMIWLMATPHSHETEQKRLGLLAGSAFLTGVAWALLWPCASPSTPASFPLPPWAQQ